MYRKNDNFPMKNFDVSFFFFTKRLCVLVRTASLMSMLVAGTQSVGSNKYPLFMFNIERYKKKYCLPL